MIDIASLRQKLNQVPTASYGTGRTFYPFVQNWLDTCSSAAGFNSWFNLWSYSAGADIDRLTNQLYAFKTELFDTSAHPPDQNWERWPSFVELWMSVAVQCNAIETQTGKLIDVHMDLALKDIPEAVNNLPETLGDVAEYTGDLAGSIVGQVAGGLTKGTTEGLLGGLFSGLGPVMIIGIAAVGYFYLTKVRK